MHTKPPSASKRGFALVVTLSLMVLLSILAIGLLSISSISLRSSNQSAAVSEAQANARMGLMLALGALQQEAGDDRRVTAASDIKMIASSAHESRYWTGVWSGPSNTDDAYTITPSASFRRWLVSGDPAGLRNQDSTGVNLANGVKLVGNNTAGPSAAEHVTVPLMNVGPTTSGMSGRYGWWVGDEGVKAPAHIPSSGSSSAAATDFTLGARGAGWETVANMGGYPERGSANEANLARVLTVPSLSLVTPGSQAYFHGLTVNSRSLLTDTRQGGLRMDLTPYVEGGFPANAVLGFSNAPVAGGNIIPLNIAPNIRGPKWDRLNALRNMRPAAGGNLIVAAGNGANQTHIAPIINDIRILMGAKFEVMPGSATDFKIHPCGKISVSLANPYSFPLEWTNDLELRIQYKSGHGTCIFVNSSSGYNFERRFISDPSLPGPSVFGNTTFTIPSGVIPPGQSRAYTMSAPVNRPLNTSNLNVPLVTLDPTNAVDFGSSITMLSPTSLSGPCEVDVREQSNTAVVSVSLSNSSGDLTRISDLELDNGNFRSTTYNVDWAVASARVSPYPIQLFSFHISQPGTDYTSLVGSAANLGVRGSTLRTFADYNIRAREFSRPIASLNSPPYFMESSDSLASFASPPGGGMTGPRFTSNLGITPVKWGHSSAAGTSECIFFDAPRDIVSIAQFQHADLTADNNFLSVGSQPSYAFANSYSPHLIKRGLSIEDRYDYRMMLAPAYTVSGTLNSFYDISYLLNTALWDSFFLSTIPPSGSNIPLNPRIVEIQPGVLPSDLRVPEVAASKLWVEGGFNVNSTRSEAWQALLASNNTLNHPSESTQSDSVMFPRSLSQTGGAIFPIASGNGLDSYAGFRRLNKDQLSALAIEMTRQVRLRGPFVSLSHFVNRALINLVNDTNKLSRSGALQSAIDNSNLNLVPGGSISGFLNLGYSAPNTNYVSLRKQGTSNLPEADLVGNIATAGSIRNAPQDRGPSLWPISSLDGNPGNVASLLSDREMLTDPLLRPEQGFRSTGIPGWLTQADILQVIGPVINARSDTFRIRSYGESLDSAGNILARAYCEAIVQRTPIYMDSANLPQTRPANLNQTNQNFGRRFKIISFRWLKSNEI